MVVEVRAFSDSDGEAVNRALLLRSVELQQQLSLIHI